MKTAKLGRLERARKAKPLIQERWAKVMKELGIEGKPIPARELQAQIRAEGLLEPNELSRGIIDMREE